MFSRTAEAISPTSLIQLGGRAGRIVPGLILAACIAVAARLAAPSTPFPPVLLALTGGLLFSFFGPRASLAPGIALSTKSVLRLGVALLGAQITYAGVQNLGLAAAGLAVGTLGIALAGGVVLARHIGLSSEVAWLTSGAVAICGASATLAIAAVLPRSKSVENNAAACVASITVIGTAAMVVYPLVATAAGLDARAAGAFLGASLHEVVQAVGAGFVISDEAGQAATAVKLIRVACLGPVILLVSWRSRIRSSDISGDQAPLVPAFLIAFVALAIAASFNVIPGTLLPILAEVSRFCLLVAMAGLGLKVSLTRLAAFGWPPLLALLAQSLLIGVLALGGTFALGI